MPACMTCITARVFPRPPRQKLSPYRPAKYVHGGNISVSPLVIGDVKNPPLTVGRTTLTTRGRHPIWLRPCLFALMFASGQAKGAQDYARLSDRNGLVPASLQEEKAQAAKPLPALSPDARYDYQGEATFILQHLVRFHSPYEGAGSLRSRDETELSHTYTLFLGARVVKNVEVYVNPELALGNGVSRGLGLAGYTDGDLIGQPSLRPEPYIARCFVRWRVPMPRVIHHSGTEKATKEQTGRAPNVIAGDIPAHRLVIQIGKFAVNDVFDVNSYANSTRSQFLSTGLNNNLAYDYAEETRGYNLGATVA